MRAPVREVTGTWARLREGREVWLWLAACLTGMAVGSGVRVSPGFFLIAALLLVILWWRWPRPKGAGRLVPVLALFLIAGWARQEAGTHRLEQSRRLTDQTAGSYSRLVVRLDEPPQRRPEYTVLYGEALAVEDDGPWRPASGRLRLGVAGEVSELEQGDQFLVRTRLRAPKGFHNPGGFDYPAFLERRGIAATGFVNSPELLAPVSPGRRPGFAGSVARVRRAYLAWLGQIDTEGGALMRALLAGDREGLTDLTRKRFEELGLSHLLSISGLHLGLVMAAGFFAVWLPLKRSTRLAERMAVKRLAAAITIPLVIAYALLSGMRPPTQRALVMVLTYLLAVILDRESDSWNALALAALVILLGWPQALFEVSVQLSFLALAVILYGAPRGLAIRRGRPDESEEALARLSAPDSRPVRLLRRAGKYLGGLLWISVLVYWGLLPLMLEWFHFVNPLTPLYNLAAVPVTGLVLLPLGMLASLFAPVAPGPALWFMRAPALVGEGMVKSLDFLAQAAPTGIPSPGFTGGGVVAWWLGGILLLEGLTAARLGQWSWQWFSPAEIRKRRLSALPSRSGARRRGLAAAVLGFGLLGGSLLDLGRPREPLEVGALTVGAIEVGQGQAILVHTPEGRTLLVDGGGFYRSDFDVGQAVVAPCLLALGVRRIDAVVLTHPHPDHARGLAYILAHFEVGEFWRGPDRNGLTDELLAIARERNIPVRVLSENSAPIQWDRTEFRVLHPAEAGDDPEQMNDQSLVLRIRDGAAAVLLCGDIEERAEQTLVEKYGPAGSEDAGALRATVMTGPHHGSRTSSSEAFLDAVRPDFVVISAAGPDQSGLPAPEVVERYERRGIEVLRTDRMGWTGVKLIDGRAETFATVDQ